MAEPPRKAARPRTGRKRAAGAAATPAPNPAPETRERREALDPATLALEHNLTVMRMDRETIQRIERLPRDVGWLLVTAGLVGIVVPGVLGTPFLILGGLILIPITNRRAERWLGSHSPRVFKGSARQINRFLDDLERRYPRSRDHRDPDRAG